MSSYLSKYSRKDDQHKAGENQAVFFEVFLANPNDKLRVVRKILVRQEPFKPYENVAVYVTPYSNEQNQTTLLERERAANAEYAALVRKMAALDPPTQGDLKTDDEAAARSILKDIGEILAPTVDAVDYLVEDTPIDQYKVRVYAPAFLRQKMTDVLRRLKAEE